MISNKINSIIILLLLFVLSCSHQNEIGKSSFSVQSEKEKFIENLLSKMTLDEKCGQLNFICGTILTGPSATADVKSSNYDDQIRKGQITGIFNTNGAKNIHHFQEVAVKESRLGIPLLIGADVIHGFKTITPIPLGEAASWDLAAIEKSASVAASEASAAGINWTFAPMVDISRDARWGRSAEGAGEDTYLGCMIAKARVKGFQGTNLKDSNTIAACIKHFAAYGAPDGGRDYNTVDMSDRRLREIYLPSYKAGLDEGAATIMTSFNEFNGVPATGNSFLLNEILRKEWNYKGLVVSDWQSIEEMIAHGNVTDRNEAGELAMQSGVDMDMMASIYLKELPQLVKNGNVDIKLVDEAVRRTLALKYDLGLFQNPYLYGSERREQEEYLSKENKAAALDVAKKSIVLLQNEKNILPLKKEIKSIALIGPLSENKAEQNGCWSFFADAKDVVTVAEGIKQKVNANCEIKIAKGCDFYSEDTSGFAEALNAAILSDVVILAVGESAVMSGEAGTRSDIRLPGCQEQLVKLIIATGKPVVICLFHGRPLDISFLEKEKASVLACWSLGTETGHAVADVLFGDYNPSGRLPMSFPRTVGQVPIYYNYKETGRLYKGNYSEPASERVYKSKYRDTKNSPLFPFGFGLSYTTFNYAPVSLSSKEINQSDTLVATIKVANSGNRDGETVVQFYLRDWVGSTTRPVRELKGFQKVFLKVGESQDISFKISNETLSFYRLNMTWGSEPGKFTAYIGENSETENGIDFFLK